MTDFKPGDVVQLKSGGPKMTIQGIGKYGMAAMTENASCKWFDGKKFVEEVFELHMLELVPPDSAKRVLSVR